MEDALEKVWESNCDYLRRLLISLTRDIDLAEDLLQETYLNARAGMSGYRGGNARAWLAVIARNVFYTHARRKSVRMETLFNVDLHADKTASNGSTDHLVLIQLRQSISNLTSTLRIPLLMKHYGGFTYEEIGERLGCPVGTARRRVWTAVRKLRAVLDIGEEAAAMKCRYLRGTRLLDYLYGGLSEKQASEVKAHLEQCSGCREEAEALKKLILGIDRMEGDDRTVRIVEIDGEGLPTEYMWWSMRNSFGETMEKTWCTCDKDYSIDTYLIQGQEVPIHVLPSSNAQYKYEAVMPRPIEPGERNDSFMVIHPAGENGRAQKQSDGTWRYCYHTTPNSARDWAFALAMRLPQGAELLKAVPEPAQVRSNGAVTLIWQSSLPSFEKEPRPWQFECSIDYKLDTNVHANKKSDTTCGKSQFIWAPEINFRVFDLPWTGCGEAALELFKEINIPDIVAITWMKLGLGLYDGGYYSEAFTAFERICQSPMKPEPWEQFISLVWRGHLMDITGHRADAIEFYRQALDTGVDQELRHDQYGIIMNRQYVEQCLKTPFERK